MVTRRKHLEFWTESKQIVLDEKGEPAVKQVSCCCAAPAASRKGCAIVAGHKTPCRCFCHSKKLR